MAQPPQPESGGAAFDVAQAVHMFSKFDSGQSAGFNRIANERATLDEVNSRILGRIGAVGECFDRCVDSKYVRFQLWRHSSPSSVASKGEKEMLCMSVCSKKFSDSLRSINMAVEMKAGQ